MGNRKASLGSARLLFARGLTTEQIAQQLGLSVATVYRWRAADKEAGIAWDVLRGKAPVGLSLVHRLESLIAEVASSTTADPVERAKALADLHRVLQEERAYEAQLAGLGRFLGWCNAALPPAEYASVTGAAARYLQQVRGVLATTAV